MCGRYPAPCPVSREVPLTGPSRNKSSAHARRLSETFLMFDVLTTRIMNSVILQYLYGDARFYKHYF
jgi:hypothetical protein